MRGAWITSSLRLRPTCAGLPIRPDTLSIAATGFSMLKNTKFGNSPEPGAGVVWIARTMVTLSRSLCSTNAKIGRCSLLQGEAGISWYH